MSFPDPGDHQLECHEVHPPTVLKRLHRQGDDMRWVKRVNLIRQQRTIKRVTRDYIARWFRQLRE